ERPLCGGVILTASEGMEERSHVLSVRVSGYGHEPKCLYLGVKNTQLFVQLVTLLGCLNLGVGLLHLSAVFSRLGRRHVSTLGGRAPPGGVGQLSRFGFSFEPSTPLPPRHLYLCDPLRA